MVIIRGGIIGTATAFYASRAELKTLALEECDGAPAEAILKVMASK